MASTFRVHRDAVLEKLQDLLNSNSELNEVLIQSLQTAASVAKTNLEQKSHLYEAINKLYKGNGWPTNIADYLDYLKQHSEMVPDERPDNDYPNAWKSDGTKNGHDQKVFDLIMHFYWLIDYKKHCKCGDHTSPQSFKKFADWLNEYMQVCEIFLDSEDSLTPETLKSFKANPKYNLELYSDNEENWQSFNKFFYREFNKADPNHGGITPLRPIAEPDNNRTIVAPADCTFKQEYMIDKNGNVLDVGSGEGTSVSFKNFKSIGTVDELLSMSSYAKEFYGGTFVHYFLDPFDYHRFHTPVGGKVLQVKEVPGQMFLDVVIKENGEFDAPDNAEDGFQFRQARGMLIIDAGEPIGKVAVLPVGMAQVSGVGLNELLEGLTVPKGTEFGRFKFGGSDIAMVLQKPPSELYFWKTDPSRNRIHFQYGQAVIHWNK